MKMLKSRSAPCSYTLNCGLRLGTLPKPHPIRPTPHLHQHFFPSTTPKQKAYDTASSRCVSCALTISRTNSSKLTSLDQPSSLSARLGSPNNCSTSAGLSCLGVSEVDVGHMESDVPEIPGVHPDDNSAGVPAYPHLIHPFARPGNFDADDGE